MKKCKYCKQTMRIKKKICKLIDVYTLLKARPFSNECVYNPDLYDAYCLRIIETLETM